MPREATQAEVDAAAGPPSEQQFEPFADSGDPTEIGKLKSLVPKLLGDRLAAHRVASYDDRIADLSKAQADFKRVCHDVEAATAASSAKPAVAAGSTRCDASAASMGDPDYVGYSDSRFLADKWVGIQVTGDTAKVLLVAHTELKFNDASTAAKTAVPGHGGWYPQVTSPVLVVLTRENGRWMLLDEATSSGG